MPEMNVRKVTESQLFEALNRAFRCARPEVTPDGKGYVARVGENLLGGVSGEDVARELRRVDWRFRAVHSSAALVFNCFAPFKQSRARMQSDLHLLAQTNFCKSFAFERRCPSGLGGTPPTLDLVVENDEQIIAIESKFTEYFAEKNPKFAAAYDPKVTTWDEVWYREKIRIDEKLARYRRLDAAQLIKHAFGLSNTFPRKQKVLLYLYWEPDNAGDIAPCLQHHEEIDCLSDAVTDAHIKFHAMSYTQLWREWQRGNPPHWLREHIDRLRARYAFTI